MTRIGVINVTKRDILLETALPKLRILADEEAVEIVTIVAKPDILHGNVQISVAVVVDAISMHAEADDRGRANATNVVAMGILHVSARRIVVWVQGVAVRNATTVVNSGTSHVTARIPVQISRNDAIVVNSQGTFVVIVQVTTAGTTETDVDDRQRLLL